MTGRQGKLSRPSGKPVSPKQMTGPQCPWCRGREALEGHGEGSRRTDRKKDRSSERPGRRLGSPDSEQRCPGRGHWLHEWTCMPSLSRDPGGRRVKPGCCLLPNPKRALPHLTLRRFLVLCLGQTSTPAGHCTRYPPSGPAALQGSAATAGGCCGGSDSSCSQREGEVGGQVRPPRPAPPWDPGPGPWLPGSARRFGGTHPRGQ